MSHCYTRYRSEEISPLASLHSASWINTSHQGVSLELKWEEDQRVRVGHCTCGASHEWCTSIIHHKHMHKHHHWHLFHLHPVEEGGGQGHLASSGSAGKMSQTSAICDSSSSWKSPLYPLSCLILIFNIWREVLVFYVEDLPLAARSIGNICTRLSYKDNSCFSLYSLGPLCLWQCF